MKIFFCCTLGLRDMVLKNWPFHVFVFILQFRCNRQNSFFLPHRMEEPVKFIGHYT